MSQAQYSVPPMNRVLVRQIVSSALGAPPEKLFAAFEPEASAAASLGQVHRAEHHDGRSLAVKIQYPNVRQTIDSDLKLARGLFKRMIKGKNIDGYFEEVRARLMEETDYVNEGRNIEFFAEQYTNPQVVTPHLVPELTSTNVLTMTFVEGQHLEPFLSTEPDQDRIDYFGQLLWDFVHEQVAANHCTMHADVHPGNFLFREDGKLGVIDFGCVKTFPQVFRDDFIRVFHAQMDGSEDELRRLYHNLEILDADSSDSELQDRLFGFFQRLGAVIVRPYQRPQFDFGDPPFKRDLNAHFKEAISFNEAIGSPHFVFVNRMFTGLFSVLFRLRSRIDTRYSLELLHKAVRTDDAEVAA
jgi:predicted unusual protein kinase regulating ubiquinone biosynthesis (AarF/ABC1/UbiB family)